MAQSEENGHACSGGAELKTNQLTPRQERFAVEFILDRNNTAAAKRAGYSERTAESQGSRLLKNVKVATRVAELTLAQTERLEFTADDILRESKNLALTHMGDFIDADGYVVGNLKDLPESVLACIQSVEQTTTIEPSGNTVIKQRLKLYDRLKALQVAGQHIDIRAFVNQHDHQVSSVGMNLSERLDEIRRKQAERTKEAVERGESVCPGCKATYARQNTRDVVRA